MNRKMTIAVVAAILACVTAATAAVPVRITYHGNLRESGGLVTGTKSMVFRLYAVPGGGAPLWTSPTYNVAVSTGLFRVVLEPAGVDWEAGGLWLEPEVAGTVLAPREEVTANPYAINALLHGGKRYTSAAAAPAGPSPGDLWYDTGANALKLWNGSAWVAAGAGLTSVSAQPGQFTGDGTAGGVLTLNASSVTLQGNAFNGAGQLVKLTGTGALPALDGSALMGLSGTDASKVAKAGDFMTGQLTTESTVTVKGNAFSVGGSTLVAASGNVGIGTTNPTEKLQFGDVVAGSDIRISRKAAVAHAAGNVPSSLQLTISDGSEGGIFIMNERNLGNTLNNQYIRFETHEGGVSAGERMRIAPNGNVGIGTTGPSSKFEVFNGSITVQGAGTGLRVSGLAGCDTIDTDALGQFVCGSDAGGANGWTDTGSVIQLAASGDNVVIQSTLTVQGNAFSVDGSTFVVKGGNVGIGTANPGRGWTPRIDVAHSAAKGDAAGVRQVGFFGSSDASNPLVLAVDLGPNPTAGSRYMGLDVSEAGLASRSLVLQESGGNVGIGTTGPSSKFEVFNGSITVQGAGTGLRVSGLAGCDTIDTDALGQFVCGSDAGGANGWTDTGSIIQLAAGGDNVVIQSTLTVQGDAFSVGGSTFVVKGGNVGIGTTGPGAMLDVASGTIRATGYSIAPTSGEGTEIGYRSDLALGFVAAYSRTAGAYRDLGLGNGLTVKAGGNVGIGETNPTAKLDVEGNAQFGSGATKSTFTATPGGATYALRLSSGVTVGGAGPLNLETGGFIRFPDGTTQATAGGAGSFVAKAGDTMTGALVLPADPTTALQAAPKQYVDSWTRPCVNPGDSNDIMVAVGDLCVDKFEASAWSTPTGGTQYGMNGAADYPCGNGLTGTGQTCAAAGTKIYARSVSGVKPSTSLTWFQANIACANAGKHLLTNAEWQAAAAGTPDPGGLAQDGGPACNTLGTQSMTTGLGTSCRSSFDVENMIGSVWEWVADWGPYGQISQGTYVAWGDGMLETTHWLNGAYNVDGSWNVAGRSYNGTAWASGMPAAVLRGGSWAYGSNAGVFAFSAYSAPSHWLDYVGFRCGRRR